MFLTKVCQEEIGDVKSFIGQFDKNKIVVDVRLGKDNQKERQLHDWNYIGIKFTNDCSHVEIVRYLVLCQADDFYGISNNYYILKFE